MAPRTNDTGSNHDVRFTSSCIKSFNFEILIKAPEHLRTNKNYFFSCKNLTMIE
jgi:hypothetical protein